MDHITWFCPYQTEGDILWYQNLSESIWSLEFRNIFEADSQVAYFYENFEAQFIINFESAQ